MTELTPDGNELLKKEFVCDHLIALKEAAHPNIVKPGQFATIAGLTNSTVMDVLRKRWIPTVETIEKWTRACGKTLPQFFADLLSDHPADEEPIVKEGYEDFYRLLTVIFDSPYPAFKAGIESNLAGLAHTVNPDHPLTKRYAALLLGNTARIKQAEKSKAPPRETSSARASPGKR